MKKHLMQTAGSALALALLSTPAFADVFVLANITKTKDVTVTETITKVKVVVLTATVVATPSGAAEAYALSNQRNFDNLVGLSSFAVEGTTDYNIFLNAVIADSISTNSGIVEVNQDVGNMANQGNALAFAIGFPEGVVDPLAAPTFFADAQAEADQRNTGNQVTHLENPDPVTNPAWAGGPNNGAVIANSINGNTGIVGVNQNAGNMPNQGNTLALAAGFGAIIALSEAALGQVNTGLGNETADVVEAGVNKLASLIGSVNGNTGVVHVNQNSGNMANQANVFALAFVTPAAP